MNIRYLAAAMVVFWGTAGARADVYQTFDLTATNFTGAPGVSLSGTYVFDVSQPAIDSIDLTASTGETFDAVTGSPTFSALPPEINSAMAYAGTGSFGSTLSITLNTLCADAVDPCLAVTLNDDLADSVSSTPAGVPAATPEPSSIALLGTGLLGFAGVLRKRFA